MKPVLLKEGTTVTRATCNGKPLKIVESDGARGERGREPEGNVWVAYNGAYANAWIVVVAPSWESAYWAAVEELPKVTSDDDLALAHGLDTGEEWLALCEAHKADPDLDWPGLAEGYSHTDGGEIVDTSELTLDPYRHDPNHWNAVRLTVRGPHWQAKVNMVPIGEPCGKRKAICVALRTLARMGVTPEGLAEARAELEDRDETWSVLMGTSRDCVEHAQICEADPTDGEPICHGCAESCDGCSEVSC